MTRSCILPCAMYSVKKIYRQLLNPPPLLNPPLPCMRCSIITNLSLMLVISRSLVKSGERAAHCEFSQTVYIYMHGSHWRMCQSRQHKGFYMQPTCMLSSCRRAMRRCLVLTSVRLGAVCLELSICPIDFAALSRLNLCPIVRSMPRAIYLS